MERSFAHTLDTGGLRRAHLRGHENILKRTLLHVAAFNMGLLMRNMLGFGTPRGLQGRVAAFLDAIAALIQLIYVAIGVAARPQAEAEQPTVVLPAQLWAPAIS